MLKLIPTLILSCTAIFYVNISVNAQQYYTKAGTVSFEASTALEQVAAENHAVVALYDKESGKIQIEIFIRGFAFTKALMQEHFNENYMESDKFPKASFTGTLKNPASYNANANGPQQVAASGVLVIHGVSRPVDITGTITTVNGFPELDASFKVTLADYDISIPAIVKDKIASTATVHFKSLLNKTLK